MQLPEPEVRNELIDAFGRQGRVTACSCERTAVVSMPQVLQLMNGENLNRQLAEPYGRLSTLLRDGKSDREVTNTLFLASQARRGTDS